MSGGTLAHLARSLSPRFNFHLSFCSRSKKQTRPNQDIAVNGEHGEAPRPAERASEGSIPHSLSSQNIEPAPSHTSSIQSGPTALNCAVQNGQLQFDLGTGTGLRRSESTASSISTASVVWGSAPLEQSIPMEGISRSSSYQHYPIGSEAPGEPKPELELRQLSSAPSPFTPAHPSQGELAFDTDCTCPICLEPIANSELEPLSGCEHILHSSCLRELISHAQSDCLMPARCPVPGCRAEVLDPDIRRVLPPPAYASYRNAEWQQYVDSHPAEFVRCPTANCTFVFAWSETGYNAAPHSALCPECQHAYCLRCRCNWHPRASCEESGGRAQDWQRTERMLVALGLRRCRQCRHWVEKSSGCNKITCRCGYRFCHKCGSENARCSCSSVFHVFYPHYMVLSNWK